MSETKNNKDFRQIMNFTGMTMNNAKSTLKQHNGNTEAAIQAHFFTQSRNNGSDTYGNLSTLENNQNRDLQAALAMSMEKQKNNQYYINRYKKKLNRYPGDFGEEKNNVPRNASGKPDPAIALTLAAMFDKKKKEIAREEKEKEIARLKLAIAAEKKRIAKEKKRAIKKMNATSMGESRKKNTNNKTKRNQQRKKRLNKTRKKKGGSGKKRKTLRRRRTKKKC